MNPYEQRRRRVLDQLQFGEMMVLYSGESVASSMDEGFEFEANHHFFYLTGLRRENMALVLANTHHPAHVILFIEEPIPDMERWTGRRVTIDEAKAVSGIDDVRYIDSVESLISRCVARETVEAAYFDCYRNAMGDTDSYNMQKAKRFAQQYPTIALKNAHTMLSAMRMVKDEDEIKTLERAIAITDQGLRRVLATLEPGRMEYQQQAEFEYEIRMRGAERVSFPTIAGSGLNGGAVPLAGGVVLSLERMNRILEIDKVNRVAVVEPGVVTNDLCRAAADGTVSEYCYICYVFHLLLLWISYNL